MAQTVKIKRSAVAGKVPTTSDLELGELAVNTYDGKLYTKKDDGTAAIVQLGPGPAVGGSNTQVLFNDSGAIGGDAGLTYNKTTDALTAAGSVTAASLIPTSSTAPTNGVFLPAANTVGIATNSSLAMLLDSSNRLVKGHTGSLNTVNLGGSTLTPGIQQHAVDQSNASIGLTNWQNSATAAHLVLGKSRSGVVGTHAVLPAGEIAGVINFAGSDGTTFGSLAHIRVDADALTSAGSTPGRMTFSTSAPGSTSPTERMRIRSDGNIGIGGSGNTSVTLYNQGQVTGGTTAYAIASDGEIQSSVTASGIGTYSALKVQNAAFTLPNLIHFFAAQGTIGASATVTNQFGFNASSGLIGATNNYGFFGNIPSGTGRWNFYANGTAPNYFAGDVRTNTVLTSRKSPVNNNASATLTTTALLDGLCTGTPTANINFTLPTGTNMDAAFQDLQTNQAFEWSVINLAAATHSITVVQGTGHTVVGNMVVAANSSGRFLTRKTTANTFITYRIG